MSWRTVIITKQSKLDYRMGYLVIRGIETKKIHLDEIKILLIENPAVSMTGFLMEALVEKKVKVVFCDSRHNPCSELIPHHGSHDSTEKIRIQIKWDDDIKARIWQEIISEKIRKQEELLNEAGKSKEATLLSSYVEQVDLLDATNREGHAAKVYFNALFGIKFTRSEDSPINAALNYGYSVILSAINREIAINGYLTQLGIFHSNMFNPYNLGSDLMEPFRIIVDRAVFNSMPTEFGKEEKHNMWRILEDTVIIDGKKQTVANAIKIYVRCVFEAINERDISCIRFYSVR